MPTLRHWLAPGTPDDARAAIQPPLVEQLIAGGVLRGRCLNAGAGEGMFVPVLDRQTGITAVVDIDLGPRRRIAGTRAPQFPVRGDLQRLPFAAASFDCCLCTEVLEHVQDDGLAARELARALVPGGHLVISVPSPPAPPDPAHVREGYSLRDLSHVLESAGFTIERHAFAFHVVMRALAHGWDAMPKSPLARRVMPKALFRMAGWVDARLPVGRPWDLIVVARRR
jgi:SAM-dependent methyltransferase